jgi:hypothetical protein
VAERDGRLGGRYRDNPTGFTGVCVGVWERLGGVQLNLSRIGTDGLPKDVWLDEERLRRIPGLDSEPVT